VPVVDVSIIVKAGTRSNHYNQASIEGSLILILPSLFYVQSYLLSFSASSPFLREVPIKASSNHQLQVTNGTRKGSN
jgi:hypothetical protein